MNSKNIKHENDLEYLHHTIEKLEKETEELHAQLDEILRVKKELNDLHAKAENLKLGNELLKLKIHSYEKTEN